MLGSETKYANENQSTASNDNKQRKTKTKTLHYLNIFTQCISQQSCLKPAKLFQSCCIAIAQAICSE